MLEILVHALVSNSLLVLFCACMDGYFLCGFFFRVDQSVSENLKFSYSIL